MRHTAEHHHGTDTGHGRTDCANPEETTKVNASGCNAARDDSGSNQRNTEKNFPGAATRTAFGISPTSGLA